MTGVFDGLCDIDYSSIDRDWTGTRCVLVNRQRKWCIVSATVKEGSEAPAAEAEDIEKDVEPEAPVGVGCESVVKVSVEVNEKKRQYVKLEGVAPGRARITLRYCVEGTGDATRENFTTAETIDLHVIVKPPEY